VKSLPRCRKHILNCLDHEVGLIELDVMAACNGDDQFSITRHCRNGRMIASVLLFASLSIGTVVFGYPASKDDQRRVAERVLALRSLGAQPRELLIAPASSARRDVASMSST